MSNKTQWIGVGVVGLVLLALSVFVIPFPANTTVVLAGALLSSYGFWKAFLVRG